MSIIIVVMVFAALVYLYECQLRYRFYEKCPTCKKRQYYWHSESNGLKKPIIREYLCLKCGHENTVIRWKLRFHNGNLYHGSIIHKIMQPI